MILPNHDKTGNKSHEPISRLWAIEISIGVHLSIFRFFRFITEKIFSISSCSVIFDSFSKVFPQNSCILLFPLFVIVLF